MASITVGVDVGGTKCLAVALDGTTLLDEAQVPTPVGAEALLDAMAAVALDVAAGAGGGARPVAVGVGAAGLVDRAGVLRFAPNLRGVDGLAVRAELVRRLGLPVVVDNDATCAAWAERQMGAAVGMDDVVVVNLGTGIGGGIVAGGRLARGANGFAGEVGHMVVVKDGPPCPCGKRGCWERFASGSGLGRLAREAAEAGRAGAVLDLAGGDPEAVRGEHVSAAARAGDADACRVLGELGWWVALGLANLANILDPEAFVVGGGLATLGDLLFDPIRAAFATLLEGAAFRPVIPILPATLGPRAGAIGAACLAAESVARTTSTPP
jgi:glucokinase